MVLQIHLLISPLKVTACLSALGLKYESTLSMLLTSSSITLAAHVFCRKVCGI